jgi:hypothetical protein
MKVTLTRLGVAVLGCAAAIMCSAAVASADPPDPHQWMGGNGWVGPTWNYDCVGDSGNNTFPAPPARWLQRGNSARTARAARPARNLTAAGGGPAPTSRCINNTQKAIFRRC